MEPRSDGRPTSIVVTDLYLASYLLVWGCKLEKVECIPTGGALSCSLTFTHAMVADYEEQFWAQKAEVNLAMFRTAYNQINGYVHQAKKAYDRAQRVSRTAAGGSL